MKAMTMTVEFETEKERKRESDIMWSLTRRLIEVPRSCLGHGSPVKFAWLRSFTRSSSRRRPQQAKRES